MSGDSGRLRGGYRFEDLVAWQKAREFTRCIYQVSREGKFARDFGLSSQIQRAAVSIMSNIAEGQERGTPSEFRHFLRIAKSSCAEVRSQLYIAHDVGYCSTDTFESLVHKSEELSKIIGGLIISLDRRLPRMK